MSMRSPRRQRPSTPYISSHPMSERLRQGASRQGPAGCARRMESIQGSHEPCRYSKEVGRGSDERTRADPLWPHAAIAICFLSWVRWFDGFGLGADANTGLIVQACGDCHLMNFGGFATPERNIIFDINDFDETSPAPWEWDVGASSRRWSWRRGRLDCRTRKDATAPRLPRRAAIASICAITLEWTRCEFGTRTSARKTSSRWPLWPSRRCMSKIYREIQIRRISGNYI